MPKMKTLMTDEESPSPEPVAPKAAEPDEAGLGALVPEHDLLQELARPCEEPLVRTDGTAPYVGFASSRSATWDSLRQLHPRIQEGTPFVSLPDGQFELADPLILYLVKFRQF